MRKFNKNKKGFTLVEVMLAVAIIAMTAGMFFSLILVVMKSHANVVSANDCADFAMINARAFENSVINAKSVGAGGDNTIQVVGNKLCKNGTPLFNLDQYKVEPGPKDKWVLTFTYDIDTNGYCNYKIGLADSNATSSVDGLIKYTYVYNGSVYIPHCEIDSDIVSSNAFTYSDY